jgi:hypothetical protein
MAESAGLCRYCLSMPMVVNHTLTLVNADGAADNFIKGLT